MLFIDTIMIQSVGPVIYFCLEVLYGSSSFEVNQCQSAAPGSRCSGVFMQVRRRFREFVALREALEQVPFCVVYSAGGVANCA